MVGDAPAIYQFEDYGVLSKVPVNATLPNPSFRFGPTIAQLRPAYCVSSSRIECHPRCRKRPTAGCKAALLPTHARMQLFSTRPQYLGLRKFSFVGGVQGYQLPVILETWKLFEGRKKSTRPLSEDLRFL